MKPNVVANFAGLMVIAVAACAQDYPNKPIRIITSPAGGGNDVPARLLAQGIAGSLGQQVVVDNRPTVLIAELAMKAPPDGYTLLFSGGPHWLGHFFEKTSYDPVKDFAPISIVDRQPVILVVHPSMPVKSVKELIALAKAKPGQLNYASGAPGGSNHLAAILFNYMAGVDILRIPYSGSSPGMIALIGGHVHMMFPAAGGATAHVKAGRLRALAVGSAEPTPLAPGVPTVAAMGVPGYVSDAVHAVFAPVKTPTPIVDKLNQEIARYLKTADAKEKFFNTGMDAVSSSPGELTDMMRSEMARIAKVVKAAGINPP